MTRWAVMDDGAEYEIVDEDAYGYTLYSCDEEEEFWTPTNDIVSTYEDDDEPD